ncbi:M48 family metallopeptidase [Oscillatoria sp. FACHB-1406]|uniref:M48 family metallopeptidase n=1 Tax=Oscillatoria sp. FACHB-1406 TaxID=2692846 RepID=UPI00168302D5|nr:M48 family metallopeptidase [Oscillatoria sp. FACHB-1406]MBD2578978.1 M48 family metalloprotease [Oscillatoria sp. FACHB-1406]
MTIAQEQFEALVAKLENFSKTHPGSYRRRVALFALLGYVYIFLVLAGLLTLIGLVISFIVFSHRVNGAIIKLVILLLIPAWAIARSLWVTFPPPEGLKLSRRQVPQLFALVDELTTKLQAPRFHNILLNRDFNAAVVQVPRLSILGWQENYLLLGLPLMQSLSLEQLKAVLAHELGHLSGNHSRFAAWIYRIRKTWMQIYERLHQSDRSGASVLFNRFLDWYWPSFNAYSFTLARMNEYEADRCASQLTGAKNMAEALINVEVKARFLESSFWSDIHKQVEHQVEPSSNTYSSMLTVLHSPIAEEQTKEWLGQALVQKTNYADTHPCLSDRLKSLGYPIARSQTFQSVTLQTSAAEHLLGDTLHQFATQFDRHWQESVSTPWRQRYAYLQETKNKLQALEQKAQMQSLGEEETWERAYYTLELQGAEAALPLLQDVLKIQPDRAEANYTIGQVLLSKADPSGIAYIEKAIAQNIDWAVDGCELVSSFFWRQGQTEEAQKYRKRAERHYQLLLKAQQERASVWDNDSFKSHTLKASQVNELRQQIASYPEVKEAYLVEKVVKYLPEKHFCVLGIIRKKGLIENSYAGQKLVDSIVTNVPFPTQAYIIILNHADSGKLKKKICQIDRALIFRR